MYVDERLTCASKIESAYYTKKFGLPICVHCGEVLPDAIVSDITEKHKSFKTVLPACESADCAAGANNGWILKDPRGRIQNRSEKTDHDRGY